MSIFLENIWIWFGLAFLVGAIGYGFFLSSRNIRTLGITVAATLAVLVVGLSLYFFVDTDTKSITRMLNGLAAAIERDDLDGVQRFILPEAKNTRGLARANMALVNVPSARFKDLKVAVSDPASPTRVAKVTFTAVVYWRTKNPVDGFAVEQPLAEFVKFDVVLARQNDHWFVTDNCNFTPRATP